MICRYKIHLREPLHIADHWPIKMFGGVMRLIEKENNVVAIQFEYTGQPASNSPHLTKPQAGDMPIISIRDPRPVLLRKQVREGLSFIQSMFPMEIDFDTIDAEYEIENDEEKYEINIFSWKFGPNKNVTDISFDLLTRSLIVSEFGKITPDLFFSTMVTKSRYAFSEKQYIDSFRYSFLLIDYLCGNGKIKSDHLRDEFLANSELTKAITMAHNEYRKKILRESPLNTSEFLKNDLDIKSIVENLIEKRGFYFHASKKRKDAWKPFDQEEAKHLAEFSLTILLNLSQKFSKPIFNDEITVEFFNRSKQSGAFLMTKITFKYRLNGETYDRDGVIQSPVVGTKITLDIASQIARDFLTEFTEKAPDAGVLSATCINEKSGEVVFEMKFIG